MLVEFCLPVYNEEKILEKNILTLLEYCQKSHWPFAWYINIVVNGSSDASLAIAKGLANKYSEIQYLHIISGGKGLAVKTAWQQSQSNVFCYMDVDLAVSLDNLEDLLLFVTKQGYDLVLGSRLLAQSQTNRPYWRSLSSIIYNYLSRIMLGHNFHDLQCGFKALKTNLRQRLVPLIKDDQWFFDTELIVWAHKLGLKIKEMPVVWQEHRYQKRKSKVKVFKEVRNFIIKLQQLRRKIKTP